MNINSPFGIEPYPDDDAVEEIVAAEPVKERTPIDPRILRSLLGGAAAVAVLGAAAAGFLWLSSTPSGEVAEAALGGARSTPPVVDEAGPVRATAVAFGQHDVFATSASASAPTGAATTGGIATTTGGSSASPSSAPRGVPTTPPVGVGTGGSKATGGTAPTSIAAPPGTTVPPATPTPFRSTAPAWEKGDVSFAEIAKDGSATFTAGSEKRTLHLGDVVPATSSVYSPRRVPGDRDMTAAEMDTCNAQYLTTQGTPAGQQLWRESKQCTKVSDTAFVPVLVPSGASAVTDPVRAGWVLGVGAVPDAALGKVTGTVRCLGQRDEEFLVRVDRQGAVWLKKGSAVPGSPLTFLGPTADALGLPGTVSFSSGSTTFVTVFGGGEDSGIGF